MDENDKAYVALYDSMKEAIKPYIPKQTNSVGVFAKVVWQLGYRLDPYPNGNSKGELLEIIDAKEAELDRARNLLRSVCSVNVSQHDWNRVAAFLAETSTVKS